MKLPASLLRFHLRPTVVFLDILIIFLFVALIVTHQVNLMHGRRQAAHNLRVTAQLAARSVEQGLSEVLHLGRLVAMQPGFIEATKRRDAGLLASQLGILLGVAPGVVAAVVVTPEGRVIASSPSVPRLIGRDVSHDEGLQSALQGGWHPYVSAVHVSEEDPGKRIADVTVPIGDGRNAVGALQLQYLVDIVRAWIQGIRVDPEGFLYVVDHQDQLVVYPFQVLPGTPRVVSDWPPVARPLLPAGDSLEFRNERSGERWLAGIYPVGETGWRAVAVQPERAVLHLLHRVLWPMGVLVGVLSMLLLVLVLSFWQQDVVRKE